MPPDVADLSPGTVLVAGTTGWRYVVEEDREAAGRAVVRGPCGHLSVDRDELLADVARGAVGVRG